MESGRFSIKSGAKTFARLGHGSETSMAQTRKVFLLLFLNKKKLFPSVRQNPALAASRA
jgi:hypothetical protein